ncbi:MAG: TetR/AcrR family transcriptional regulator [Solirubrobacterales bacterium]
MPTGAENEKPELRAAVLAAARGRFLKSPYEEVRVDDIVADAGVAKGLAFYYFESKRGLYNAVVRSLLMELAERTRPDPDLPPREREVAAVEAFVVWADETEGVDLILASWSAGDEELDAMFRAALDQLIGQTISSMHDMPGGPGTVDALPPELLGRAIWGWMSMARTIVADWLTARDIPRDELRDLLVGALDGVYLAARNVAEQR